MTTASHPAADQPNLADYSALAFGTLAKATVGHTRRQQSHTHNCHNG
jgi:hypothetical protein